MLRAEVCVDSVAGALAAQEAGAHRVELCSALGTGGLTPSAGLVEEVLAAIALPVHVLVRPREGDFVHDAHEVAVMARDVGLAVRLGAHGVVVGALTPDGDVDLDTCGRLVDAAAGRPVTFHRAFDLARDPLDALDAVLALGADRLLTSGQEATALAGAPLIAALVRAAGDRLTVMAGGGVTAGNVARIVAATGVREIHFSGRDRVASAARYRNERVALSGPAGDYERRTTSRAVIEAVLAAAR
ncbi:copper homeostasis protein CutC [Virgisporangium ochraceum]|uniref:copper homeostasis protein CutC n=1 Tax=Virgisporangium ochraceum TaxID=65505 RepID=UPI0019415937|nr:copper homeostasis protein CutC [Virgisporangium ochraceum]